MNEVNEGKDKKSLLILGSSSELGIELIRRISGQYDSIIAHYNSNRTGIDALDVGDKLTAIQADFANPDSTAAFVDCIESEYGAPTHIVHMPAAKVTYKRFHQSSWDSLADSLGIQLRSVYLLLSRLIRRMAKQDGAKIVFVLTSNTIAPVKYMAEYTVVKQAQLGLMRSLAVEYPTVSINAVSPSMIETKFVSDLPAAAVRQTAAENPQGRNAVPSDVVPAIAFLLSDGAGYITGQNIVISGGGVL